MELHLWREYRDVLLLARRLGLLKLRRCLVLGLAMYLALLRLHHLLRRRVGVRVVELVFALHRNLRGRLAGWHSRGDSLLSQVVDQVEELLLLSTLRAALGLDLLLVVVSLLRLQVVEHYSQVHGGTLMLASLHGSSLQQEGEGVPHVLPLVQRQLLVPPRGVDLAVYLGKV